MDSFGNPCTIHKQLCMDTCGSGFDCICRPDGEGLSLPYSDTTGQSSIEDALSLLSTCPDIKLMLNAAMFSPSGRRFGAYYGYGG